MILSNVRTDSNLTGFHFWSTLHMNLGHFEQCLNSLLVNFYCQKNDLNKINRGAIRLTGLLFNMVFFITALFTGYTKQCHLNHHIFSQM